MKILHLSSNNIWRGGEQQILYLLEASTSAIENHLYCPKGAAIVGKYGNADKIHIYKKRAGFDILAGAQLKKLCRDLQFDLIDIHDSHAINTYWVASLLGFNIPAVIHRHVNFPVGNIFKYRNKNIRKIICVSEAVKQTMAVVVDEKKLCVIHPGIQVGLEITVTGKMLRNEFSLPDNSKIIGTVSALEKEKNLFQFLDIAEQTIQRDPACYFFIFGSGSLQNELAKCIKEKKLATKIILAGFRNDIQQILPQLDLFLYTSSSEGFSLVVAEAMSSGIPVVTRDSGGIKEIISNNETGMTYQSAEEGCKKIIWALTHESEKNKLTHRAYNFVQQFSVENMIQKTHTLYKEIVQ